MSLLRDMRERLSLGRQPAPAPQPVSAPPPPPDPLSRFRNCPEKLVLDFEILAFDQGLLSTMLHNLPVDADGKPIPWYTYPAIEYLRQFDLRDRHVFEYGCGNSSHFWAGLGATVWAVDHNPQWHDKMAAEAKSSQTFYLGSDRDDYLQAIKHPGRTFDVVVIDGEWREECVQPAIEHLAPGGFIILDNADRDRDAGRALRARDFFEVDFNGFGPINDYTWTTAIFLPPGGSRLRIQRPPLPVGGHPSNKSDA